MHRNDSQIIIQRKNTKKTLIESANIVPEQNDHADKGAVVKRGNGSPVRRLNNSNRLSRSSSGKKRDLIKLQDHLKTLNDNFIDLSFDLMKLADEKKWKKGLPNYKVLESQYRNFIFYKDKITQQLQSNFDALQTMEEKTQFIQENKQNYEAMLNRFEKLREHPASFESEQSVQPPLSLEKQKRFEKIVKKYRLIRQFLDNLEENSKEMDLKKQQRYEKMLNRLEGTVVEKLNKAGINKDDKAEINPEKNALKKQQRYEKTLKNLQGLNRPPTVEKKTKDETSEEVEWSSWDDDITNNAAFFSEVKPAHTPAEEVAKQEKVETKKANTSNSGRSSLMTTGLFSTSGNEAPTSEIIEVAPGRTVVNYGYERNVK